MSVRGAMQDREICKALGRTHFGVQFAVLNMNSFSDILLPRFVAKRLKDEAQQNPTLLRAAADIRGKHNVPSDMHLDAKLQTVCQFWAQAFNKCRPPKTISFLQPKVVTINGVPHFVEEFFEGTHRKFNSNGAFVGMQFFSASVTPQAFPLWTLQKSGNRVCVLDLQGFALKDRYVFNDPAMVSKDLNLSLTDAGEGAIQSFLTMHQMSSLDKYLGIGGDATHFVESGHTKVM